MNEAWVWWLFAVGLVIGAAAIWFIRGTIAREDDDLARDERSLEAEWVAETIERSGGVAPVLLVEQVLELHRDYLRSAPPHLAGEPPAIESRGAGAEATDLPGPPAGSTS